MHELSPHAQRIAEDINRLPPATRDVIGQVISGVVETIADFDPDTVSIVATVPVKYVDPLGTPRHLRLARVQVAAGRVHPGMPKAAGESAS